MRKIAMRVEQGTNTPAQWFVKDYADRIVQVLYSKVKAITWMEEERKRIEDDLWKDFEEDYKKQKEKR